MKRLEKEKFNYLLIKVHCLPVNGRKIENLIKILVLLVMPRSRNRSQLLQPFSSLQLVRVFSLPGYIQKYLEPAGDMYAEMCDGIILNLNFYLHKTNINSIRFGFNGRRYFDYQLCILKLVPFFVLYLLVRHPADFPFWI